jgi:hypothetical protein
MAADINLTIGASFAQAQKSINDFSNNTQKQLSGLQSSFNTLRNIALGAVAVIGTRAIIKTFQDATKAAAEQQDAIQNLNSALINTGEFTEEISKDFQNFASEIQKASTFGDELVLNQIALAKGFGLSNDKAKELVRAAVDLAAFRKIPLETAVRQLSGTLTGVAGPLGRVRSEFRDLTEEQLKNGEAIRLVQKFYQGAAQRELETYSGATKALNNAYGDLLEVLGGIVVENPAVVKAINTLQEGIVKVTEGLADTNSSISIFVGNFFTLATNLIPGVVTAVNVLVSTFNGIKIVLDTLTAAALVTFEGLKQQVLTVVNFVLGAVDRVAGFSDKILGTKFQKSLDLTSAINKNSQAITNSSLLVDAYADKYFRLSKESDKAANKQIKNLVLVNKDLEESEKALKNNQKGYKDLTDSVKKAEEAQKKLAEQAKKATDETLKIREENSRLEQEIAKIGKTTDEVAKIDLEYRKQKIDAQIATLDLNIKENKDLATQLELQKELLDTQFQINKARSETPKVTQSIEQASVVQKDISDSIKKSSSSFDFSNLFKGIGSSILDGFKKLPSLLSGIFSGPISAFGGFAESLATGPQKALEAFDKFDETAQTLVGGFASTLSNFIKRLPEFVQNLIGQLRTILAELISNLPDLVRGLVDAFGDLLIFAFEEVIPKLIAQLPAVLNKVLSALPRIINGILRSLPAIITEVFKALPLIVREIAAAIPGLVQVLADNLSPIVIALTQGIIEAIPDIVIALVDELITKGGIFRIAFALAKALSVDLPIALAQGFVRALANLGSGAFEFLGRAFSKGIKFPELKAPKIEIPTIKIPTPGWLNDLKRILDSFNPAKALGGGGGGGGFIGKVGKTLGFAQGGTIPQGFPNDTFPARLTSGEEVISFDRANRIDAFLDREERQDRNVTINLQVGESQLAQIIYSLNQRGFRTA